MYLPVILARLADFLVREHLESPRCHSPLLIVLEVLVMAT